MKIELGVLSGSMGSGPGGLGPGGLGPGGVGPGGFGLGLGGFGLLLLETGRRVFGINRLSAPLSLA